jgi:hypothetical protein
MGSTNRLVGCPVPEFHEEQYAAQIEGRAEEQQHW